MEQTATFLRGIALRLGQPGIAQIVADPGIREVVRVTVQYRRSAYAAVVATLIAPRRDDIRAQFVYQGHFGHRPLTRTISAYAFETFDAQLRATGFDRLHDEADISLNSDLWMIERGAARFTKSVVLSPSTALQPYAALVAQVRAFLPEIDRRLEFKG
ncbi:MAG TPA: hypothetical protein PKX07_06030 [Aggregatilineales bacterium]|jgi:hypothetical protein|nr:hypothetical protein [Aggregatilineales bacterium]